MLYCPLYFFSASLALAAFSTTNNTSFSNSSSPPGTAETQKQVDLFHRIDSGNGGKRERESTFYGSILHITSRRSLLRFQQSSRSFLYSALVVSSANVLSFGWSFALVHNTHTARLLVYMGKLLMNRRRCVWNEWKEGI